MDLRRCEDRMQGRSLLAADIPARERVPALPRATTNFRQKVRGDAALPVSDAQRSQLKAGCCRSRWPSPLAAIDPERSVETPVSVPVSSRSTREFSGHRRTSAGYQLSKTSALRRLSMPGSLGEVHRRQLRDARATSSLDTPSASLPGLVESALLGTRPCKPFWG